VAGVLVAGEAPETHPHLESTVRLDEFVHVAVAVIVRAGLALRVQFSHQGNTN
jgi:hypothetical protein